MKRRRLTPTAAGLLLLGASTALFMGVPDVAGRGAPLGSVVGIVHGPDGALLEDVQVALFDAATLTLRGTTRTDEAGRFAFPTYLPKLHLLVGPDEPRGLLGRWLLDRAPSGLDAHQVTLEHGVPLEVRVSDEHGLALEGVEVRAYEPGLGDTTCLVRTLTDDGGRARLRVPSTTHIGALGTPLGRRSSWSFDLDAATAGILHLALPEAVPVLGRAATPDGHPLEGLVASSWDERADGWHWNGYRLTDAFGDFELPGATTGTLLRLVDPAQERLPLELTLAGEALDRPRLTLETGSPLAVPLTAGRDPRHTRVRAWSGETGAWGWGSRPEPGEVLTVHVSPEHQVLFQGLTPGSPPAEE